MTTAALSDAPSPPSALAEDAAATLRAEGVVLLEGLIDPALLARAQFFDEGVAG